MSNKIKKINKQLERLETQRKELLQKKQAEEEAVLLEIGRAVTKCISIEEVDMDKLQEILKKYYWEQEETNETEQEGTGQEYEKKSRKQTIRNYNLSGYQIRHGRRILILLLLEVIVFYMCGMFRNPLDVFSFQAKDYIQYIWEVCRHPSHSQAIRHNGHRLGWWLCLLLG